MATVLIVDDEADIRMILDVNLTRWGHQTLLASNAAEAYTLVVDHDPGALLLDISMPGESGLQLLKRLRDDGLFPPEVALLSAALSGPLPPEVTDHGVRLLPKPFGVQELQELVEAMTTGAS